MNYILFFTMMSITACVIWFQTVAPIRFPIFLSKYIWVVYLMSLITGVLFVQSSKLSFTLFESAWSLRFLGFAINTIIFAVLTYFIVDENWSLKNTISIGLAIVIVLVQVFVD